MDITISLPSNRSTGYGWQTDKEGVTTSYRPLHIPEPGDQPLIGGEGVETMVFSADKGEVVTFHYGRSWEDKDPLEVVQVTVVE